MLYQSRSFSWLSLAVFWILFTPTFALRRTVGPPHDDHFAAASKACNGSERENFEFGKCSLLIACVYSHLDEAIKISLSSGTNIASLLPTILVLIGKLVFRLLLSSVHCAFVSPFLH